MLHPEPNAWGSDSSAYNSAIGSSKFAFNNLNGGKPGADGPAGPRGPERPNTDGTTGTDGASPEKKTEGKTGEKSVEQQYQDTLREAAAKGLPVVVVFGSQSALDTQKQATQTLRENMAEGKALYMFVDTDKLDPNSELGKVARRDDKQGLGLGPTGKSDLVFTGVYKVDQKPDGSVGIGNSVATFWGGRGEISATMRQQLQFATTKPQGPDVKPSDGTVPPPRPSVNPGRPDDPTVQPKDRDRPRDPSRPKDPDRPTDPERPKDPNEKPKDPKDTETEARERKRQDEERRAEQRKKRYKELVSNTQDKGYNLEQYADGWGKFLDRTEMESGPTRDMVDQIGRQMITGDFDGKQLAGLMDKVGKTDQATMDQRLQEVNKQLSEAGLKLQAKVNPETGKISEFEVSGNDDGKPTSLRITADGRVIGSQSGKEITASQASIRLAKKAEPAACP